MGARSVVPEVSACHPAVAVNAAAAGDGVLHWGHQSLLRILWDPRRVDELMLLLLQRPLPLLGHLLVRRGVHHGGRGHRSRLLSHVHWRELQENLKYQAFIYLLVKVSLLTMSGPKYALAL